MAEYVRRRRPPANHPYWNRLHDRAHPPPVLRRIAFPTAFGLGIGLYGGMNEPFTVSDCVRWATLLASGLGGFAFVISAPFLMIDASRHLAQRDRWMAGIFAAVCCGVFVLMVGWLALFVALLLCYAPSTGEGPWVGMLIGAATLGVPASLAAILSRRNWKQRQRAWPRWERMRLPRRRSALTLSQVAAPPSTPQPESSPTLSGDSGLENRV